MVDEPLLTLVSALVTGHRFQSLWQIKDRGVPVFAHTVDVVMLALDAFPEWSERYTKLSLRSVTLASLLHDLDKLLGKTAGHRSHSQTMSVEPMRAVGIATDVLQEALWQTGVRIAGEDLDHVWHIVASHHGHWGKVQPETPEAALVHQCDFVSASRHRVTPVDASDILPLLDQGMNWVRAAACLEVTSSVIRDRLLEACRAERVVDVTALQRVWHKRGFVVTGTMERMRKIEEVRQVLREARIAPTNIIEHLRKLGRLPTPN